MSSDLQERAAYPPQPIRVLLVGDNAGDARLILELLRELPAEDFDLERVDRLAPAPRRDIAIPAPD
jgi:hypothetical protein